MVNGIERSRVMGQHRAGMDDRMMGDRVVDIGMDDRSGDELGCRVDHMPTFTIIVN